MVLSCNMFYQAQGFFLLLFFSLKHIFIIRKLFYNTHQVRCYHFFIVEIIDQSVNLIQMLKQNRKFCHHDRNNYVFIKKVHLKTQSKKKDVLLIFTLQETKNSNLFDKSCTQVNRTSNAIWIKLTLMNRNWTGKLTLVFALFPERNTAHTFSKPPRKK